MEIHAFGDASPRAYCAAVYLHVYSDEGHSCQLVASKARLCPTKTPQTLPRLELMAALIAARLANQVADEIRLKFDVDLTMYGWTDSSVTYFWISGVNKSFKLFIQNRAREIRELLPPSQWRHIEGKRNPADFSTKPHSLKKWIDNSLWWNGPIGEILDHDNEEHRLSVSSIFCDDPEFEHQVQSFNVVAFC